MSTAKNAKNVESKNTLDLGRIEIKTLMGEIQRRQGEIGRVLHRRRSLEKKLNAIDQRLEELGVSPTGGIPGRVKRARNNFSLVDALCMVLRDQAMGIPRIMSALPTVGYRSESPNLRTMVNVALLKQEYFKRVSRGVYIAKPTTASRVAAVQAALAA